VRVKLEGEGRANPPPPIEFEVSLKTRSV